MGSGVRIDGEKLRLARRSRGWTVAALVKQTDGALAKISIYRIERAGITGVHEATMFALAAALGLAPLALMPDADPAPEAGQTPRAETES